MTKDSIQQFLSQFVSGLSLDELLFFQSKLEKKEYKKKDVILNVNDVENYLGFLEKGVVRYSIPKKEKDITVNIVFENDFVSSYCSFVKRDSSKIM